MTDTVIQNITPVPVQRLEPNPWNPNKMADAGFSELVVEVRRLGRVPKPIVVRRRGEKYEIVDGEHSWQAALELGFTEVLCEIIEAGDFEAMLQTYKRNQHGQHSPVLEGRMFRDMQEQKKMGKRELARAAGLTEGTIRNRVLYANAADLRNRYADKNCDAEIDALQVRQVRSYVDLPQPLRDMWLDAGGQMELLGKHKDGLRRVGLLIQRYALTEYLDADNFRESFGRLSELCEWLEQNEHVPGAADFARPIAEMELPALAAWIIPTRPHDAPTEICIDLESWLAILQDSRGRGGISEEVALEIAGDVCERLEDLDIDPRQVYDGLLFAQIEMLLETPCYIREAHRLTIEERVQLHYATAPAPPDVIDDAKRETIATIGKERAGASAGGNNRNCGPGYVQAVFLSKVRNLLDDSYHVIEPRCFDRDRVLQSLDAVFQSHPHLRDASVAGHPAFELFRDRMTEVGTPELILVGTMLHGAIPSVALGEWMDAVHADHSGEPANNRSDIGMSSNSTMTE